MKSPSKKHKGQSPKKGAVKKGRRETAFERGLAMLKQYVKREKTADVPVMHLEGEYALGRWVANQRAKYHRGETSECHIKALESQPGWSWNAWDKDWDRAIKLLRAYELREGHARCPANHIEKGFALGAWVARQRARYAAGRLTPNRAADLESLTGFLGNWKKAQSQSLWDTKFEALKRFASEHGHTRVPRNYVKDGVSLGIWVNSVRSQHTRGSLSEARVVMLESIPGWEWAKSRQEAWAHGLERLRVYVAQYGHALVPRSYIDETGFRLGEWVGKRRSSYKLGKLASAEIAELEGVPGWVWSMRKRPIKQHGQ